MSAHPRPKIRISVTDSGWGLPEEMLNLIFDSFCTTKSVQKGTGLGLSITCDIIKAHSVRIPVNRELGKGTTFIITLSVEINT